MRWHIRITISKFLEFTLGLTGLELLGKPGYVVQLSSGFGVSGCAMRLSGFKRG